MIEKGVRHFLKQTENRTKHKLYRTTFHTNTDTTSTIARLVVTTGYDGYSSTTNKEKISQDTRNQDTYAAKSCSIVTDGHDILSIALHVNIRREVKIVYLNFVPTPQLQLSLPILSLLLLHILGIISNSKAYVSNTADF